MAETSGGFSAQDAARTLAELPEYEERLTLRTAGLTWMIWGIAVPGIFLTYGTGHAWTPPTGLGWLEAVYWVPWIAGASWATSVLWKTHAITTGEEDEVSGWQEALIPVGFTAFFLVALFALVFLGPDLQWTAYPLVVTGVLTVFIALVNQFIWGYPGQAPVYVVGALIAVAGVAVGLPHYSDAATSLLAAGTVAVGYFGLGALYLARG